jgi:hypothetical protein
MPAPREKAVKGHRLSGCEEPDFSVERAFLQLTLPDSLAALILTAALLAELSAVLPQGTDMTLLQDHTGEPASRREPNSAAPVLLLAPDVPTPRTSSRVI